MPDFDVIVIGGGHAGCEAAYASASMGLKTCLLTISFDTIAQMSCNPAIGGLAKGHLVREIDALGGLMGRLADDTGIQFRLLNRSRGGAVQAPRAQSDKARYKEAMRKSLENTSNLTMVDGTVAEILVKNQKANGVRTLDGKRLNSRVIILTPGTFLNGLIHIGLDSHSAGRADEPASIELSNNINKLGLKTFRLKTGTPMRLHKNSIEWSLFKTQEGDKNPIPFSFRTKGILKNEVVCHIGYTNMKTHEIIHNNLNKSPLFSGKIIGIGPRYCPSIEDKVVKFPHHKRHQFFLEPEGLDTEEIYVNGLSSSLPLEVQKNILKSIPGLDRAKILKPAYGIEYDAVTPTQLKPTLETRHIKNLFLAGQINGTSGYEEAAAQGLIAGINAALKIKQKKPLILRRDEAYIGVLIDDLISKGVEEPYRLFTSRAEYRLHLRVDNADKRLMKYGFKLGLISEKDYNTYRKKQERIQNIMTFLQQKKVRTENYGTIPLKEWLKKPEVTFQNVLEYMKSKDPLPEEDIRHIESEIKYEGYIKKQSKEIAHIQKMDKEKIPKHIEFQKIPGLTREVKEKLEKYNPKSIGDAKKIPGITPAAIVNIHIYIKLMKGKKLNKSVPRET